MSIQELPLNEKWLSLGAIFSADSGWDLPHTFKGVDEEYTALHESAGLIDQSSRGKIDVVGKDRIDFLHRMLTQDIESLEPGASCMASLLNGTGKIQSIMNVYCFNESILLDVDPGEEKTLIPLLDRVVLADQVKLIDVTKRYVWLYLWGPQSADLVEDLFWDGIHDLEEDSFATIPYGDITFSIMRSSYYKQGYTFYVHRDHAGKLVEMFLEKGKAFDLEPVGCEAYEMRRIEKGVLQFGIDMNTDMTLPEAGLISQTTSDSKGCYPGQEVVARTATYGGLNRQITGLILEGQRIPSKGDLIYKGEKKIGEITSACYCRKLGKPVALALIRKPHFAPNETLNVVINDLKLSVTTREAFQP